MRTIFVFSNVKKTFEICFYALRVVCIGAPREGAGANATHAKNYANR